MIIKDLSDKILKIYSTRVWRTYLGGKEIEKWEGTNEPQDGEFPEIWVASTVKAINPGREYILNGGLSEVKNVSHDRALMKDIIDSDPEIFLGKQHCEKYGNNSGMLVKIIDAMNRLTIQVHPDKKFAKEMFSSEYGKTEAWYIMGGRETDGEAPYILIGFKPGITYEKWKDMFHRQEIPLMLESLHKVYVKPGEVYFLDAGVPHAIGAGCFLVEVQEPTDYTIRVERKTPEGIAINDRLCHQGLGFEKIMLLFTDMIYGMKLCLSPMIYIHCSYLESGLRISIRL